MSIKVNDRVTWLKPVIVPSDLALMIGTVRGFDDQGRAIVLFDGESKARILPPHALDHV